MIKAQQSHVKFQMALALCLGTALFGTNASADTLSAWANGRYSYQCVRSTARPFDVSDSGRVNPFTKITQAEVTAGQDPKDTPTLTSLKDIFVHENVIFEKDVMLLSHNLPNGQAAFSQYATLSTAAAGSMVSYDLDNTRPNRQMPDGVDVTSVWETPPTLTQIFVDSQTPGATKRSIRLNWEEPKNDDDYVEMNYDCALTGHTAVAGEAPPASDGNLNLNKLKATLADGNYTGVTFGMNGMARATTPDGTCTVSVSTTATGVSIQLNTAEDGHPPVALDLSVSARVPLATPQSDPIANGDAVTSTSFSLANVDENSFELGVNSNAAGAPVSVFGLVKGQRASCSQLHK